MTPLLDDPHSLSRKSLHLHSQARNSLRGGASGSASSGEDGGRKWEAENLLKWADPGTPRTAGNQDSDTGNGNANAMLPRPRSELRRHGQLILLGIVKPTQVLDPLRSPRGSQDCGSKIFHKPFLPCCCGW